LPVLEDSQTRRLDCLCGYFRFPATLCRWQLYE